jgi:hypothetical protein
MYAPQTGAYSPHQAVMPQLGAYYHDPVKPLMPQYLSPYFQSPPVNLYSDGTRYPKNMEAYDYYAPKAGKRLR